MVLGQRVRHRDERTTRVACAHLLDREVEVAEGAVLGVGQRFDLLVGRHDREGQALRIDDLHLTTGQIGGQGAALMGLPG